MAGEWSLCSMVPADGYICSLAVPHRGGSVRILPRLTAEAVLELARGTTLFPPEGISDRLPK